VDLTPAQVVAELDRYIIGQDEAKRAVAIALRNRYRRKRLAPEVREDILPKNILMIGPTGVGKTEIARRLARLAGAPFVKIEATKFTEVGYVGRDVESIIRELVDVALRMVKVEKMAEVQDRAEALVEDRLVELLVPSPAATAKMNPMDLFWGLTRQTQAPQQSSEDAEKIAKERKRMRQLLRMGELEDHMVEVVVEKSPNAFWEMPGSGLDDLGANFKEMLGDLLPKKMQKRTMTVREARGVLLQEEATKLLDMDALMAEAVALAEESGIVFIDEIDKIAGRSSRTSGPDVSREGVQRDILPIIEGSTVITKAGPVRTDYILFIAAGAFHISQPADLIPELQGRFPIRVNLNSLKAEDFARILTEPANSLTKQYMALLGTEGVTLEFIPEGVMAIAKIAEEVNRTTENIGARRLHTILERLLEEVSFAPPQGEKVVIDAEYVQSKLAGLVQDRDLTRYIL
jgi:ATP-dependent HslUV protease ATP-binding subunit HslU